MAWILWIYSINNGKKYGKSNSSQQKNPLY